MIKDARWQGTSLAVHIPFVKFGDTLDLAIVFPQDAGERFEYITPHDLQNEAIKNNFEKWQANIDQYPYEIEISEELNKRIIFASGQDHSAEKILSSAFLAEACRILNTDKLLISRQKKLVYSTMDDLYDENDQINFQKIIEKNKIPVSYP